MKLAKPLIAWKPFQFRWQAPSARLRSYLPCQYLEKEGYSCEIFEPKNIDNYQLVIFQKAYAQEDIELAKSLKNVGTKIVFDLCDNHFYNPEHSPVLTERKERLYQILEIADTVTVSTCELQKVVASEGKDSIVIDDVVHQWWTTNLWEDLTINARKLTFKKKNLLKLVWYGSAGLDSPPFGMIDLEQTVPILEAISQQFPIQLTVISDSEEKYHKYLSKTSFSTRYFKWELTSFPRLFKENDICLIPINLNPFTICKSNNRLILSLLLGVPAIADKIPSYEEFNNFVLFSDWENSLYTYATQPELRREHIKQGINYIQSKYNKKRVIEQWSSLFKTVLET